MSDSQTPSTTVASTMPARRFWLWLAVLCGAALFLRLAMLHEFITENPIAQRPWADGMAYWDAAGHMAEGHWTSDEPFLFAPLYPYFLGVVRAAGGGLGAVYAIQLAMHLAVAVLIALATRLRASAAAGLVAAGLFLALTEPAVSSSRLVANTLQLAIIGLLWWRWVALAESESRSWEGIVVVGLLIGVLALGYPPAMLLVPAYGAWLVWKHKPRTVGIIPATVGVLCAIAPIAPATIHNLRASGEFVPIAGHAGITLRHGNGARSIGIYTPVEGISTRQMDVQQSAARLFEDQTGQQATRAAVNRYFRDQAVHYWVENPRRAAKLFALKLYWFLASKNYDDMMPSVLEREFGIGERAILAPLAVPYLLGAALAGLIGLMRTRKGFAPEILLIAVPLITVLLFFYTPRYRLPAVPVLCGLAAYALMHYRSLGYPKALVVLLWLLPVPLLFLNNSIRFGPYAIDDPGLLRPNYARTLYAAQLLAGDAALDAGEYEDAGEHYQAVAAGVETYFQNVKEGAYRAPTEQSQAALVAVAGRALRKGGYACLTQGDLALNEGVLDRAKVWYEKAGRSFGKAVGTDPRDPLPYRYLYEISNRLARFDDPQQLVGSRQILEKLVAELEPDAAEPKIVLAWMLATLPMDEIRDGARAVALARPLTEDPSIARFVALDVLAAAYAEAGRFEEAIATATTALQAAQAAGVEQAAQQIEQRLAGYRENQPARALPLPIRVEVPK